MTNGLCLTVPILYLKTAITRTSIGGQEPYHGVMIGGQYKSKSPPEPLKTDGDFLV